ncbi:MAG: aminotransferase class I/II-fold pyridoxal phosphate-dependent enzyme [Bacteroidia bacterium]|nr:aminotransferase class I/II-fold pyridoxal phosphate-dependent enzyme [Bacteroidia bacterium]
MIDLRSDTVTRPVKGMLEAMMSAKVGDDVFGEDPTVNALEEKVARMFSHEAALFCPSGTMTNQIAMKVHTQPGDEVICDISSHIYNYESGGLALNSGAQAKLIHGDRGRITAAQVEESINPVFDWLARTSLVSVENTCNKGGGSIYPFRTMHEIAETCRKNHLKLHLDGARIFNAIVETGDSTEMIGEKFDSISVCLSKGLGAPAGSLLVGSKAFINKARRVRKVFGGGMRQAGYIAAAGAWALENHVARLKEDHRRANEIGTIMKEHPLVESVLPVETNIVIFTLHKSCTANDMIRKMNGAGILAVAFGKNAVRLVTHLDFTDDMLESFLKEMKKIG